MTEEITEKLQPNAETSDNGNTSKPEQTKKPKPKPPKLEDKPFSEFINNHYIPEIKASLTSRGVSIKQIGLNKGVMPITGLDCWILYGELQRNRRFWLYFSLEDITSNKTIALAESESEPSMLESFLIDEKKTTLPLLVSRLLQRLNGQKWIGAN